MRLYTLELAIRATLCLESVGITNVGQLCEWSAGELLNIRHFGETTLQEVREKLAVKGLRLRGE
jgi:DNA-directed RNA polymerase subunit alpha